MSLVRDNTFDNSKWTTIESNIDLTSETDAVLPIKVKGSDNTWHWWAMHSDYFFDLKKVYKKEPQRTNSGRITVFPDKFFVPYFKVKFGVITMETYKAQMAQVMEDELTVQYYDSFDRKYKTAKFYAQQPTYNQLYTMKGDYNFVTDLEIVFSGTMNPVE